MFEYPTKEVPEDHEEYAQFCRCKMCFEERLRRWLMESLNLGGVLYGPVGAS